MRVLYLRYNKNSKKKAEKEQKELQRFYDEVILAPVTSGRKILKKEIEYIENLLNKEDIEKLVIKYTAPEELSKFKKEIREKIEIFEEEKNYISPREEVKVYFEILKKLKEKELNIKKDKFFFEKILGKRSEQTYFNYMEKLLELFSPLIIKEHKKDGVYYSLRDADNIILEVFEKVDDIIEIGNILATLSDKDIKNLSLKTREFIKRGKSDFLFKSRPFENLSEDSKLVFKEIKRAIKEKRFLDIYGYLIPVNNLKGYEKEDYEDVLPLKIIFMENNWYLAGVIDNNNEKIVRFFRIAFIDDCKAKETYPKNLLKKEYIEFLENFETPFTLYKEKWKKAILRIHPDKVFYFEQKPHFPKQKIINKDKSNFLIEVKYTQYLEIAPIIKKWIPYIEVVECDDDLKEKLKKELQNYLQNF